MEPVEKNNASHADGSVVQCRTCGAEFSSDLPNCPYCGTMYLPAAEEAYMNKLEGVRSNLEQLSDLPAAESRKHFRRLMKRVLIAAAVLLILVLAGQTIRFWKERRDTAAEKAETLWQREGFARMDEAWSSGDYDMLLLLYQDAIDSGHSVYAYRHSDFCTYLQQLQNTESALKEVNEGYDSLTWLLLNELGLYSLEEMRNLTPEERAVLEEFRQPFLEDLQQRFAPSEEELNSFRDTLHKDGWVSYGDCERVLDEKGMKP